MNNYKGIVPKIGASIDPNKAYHDIPYFGLRGPTHRSDTKLRVNRIASVYDVQGKLGLDIGCNVGGISFGLVDAGAAHMTGVDYDESSIGVALQVSELHCPASTDFHALSVPSPEFWSVFNLSNCDFVVWLSNFMWIVEQQGFDSAVQIIEIFREKGKDLIFDTAQHQKDGAAGKHTPFNSSEDVKKMLERIYDNVVDTGPMPDSWNQRNLFVCTV